MASGPWQGLLRNHHIQHIYRGSAILRPTEFWDALSLFRGLRGKTRLYNLFISIVHHFHLNIINIFRKIIVTVSILGSSWHVAETVITSAYRALSKELITAELGAYVGLGHINITLCGKEGYHQFFLYISRCWRDKLLIISHDWYQTNT